MAWAFQPILEATAELESTPVTYPGYIKVYMGAGLGWVYKPMKIWDGSQWVIKPLKWYDTSTTSWKITNGL